MSREPDSTGPEVGPTWKPPNPYGAPAAIELMGSVAAPLLAGFSLTLLVLVVSDSGALRWPDLALFFLAVAAVTLIAVVQFTFWSRSYTVDVDQLRAWWPTIDNDERRRTVVRGEQLAHEEARRLWSNRARRAYRLGVVALLLGVAVALLPMGPIRPLRWAAIGVVVLGVCYELLWMLAAYGHKRAKTWAWARALSPRMSWKPPPTEAGNG